MNRELLEHIVKLWIMDNCAGLFITKDVEDLMLLYVFILIM